MSQWFKNRRQEFIAATFRQFGQIRRADIMRQFEVTAAIASADSPHRSRPARTSRWEGGMSIVEDLARKAASDVAATLARTSALVETNEQRFVIATAGVVAALGVAEAARISAFGESVDDARKTILSVIVEILESPRQ